MSDPKQQKTDDEGFAIITPARTIYSTIDQFNDGNARSAPRPDVGPFFNRNSETTLTPAAQAIIDAANKK